MIDKRIVFITGGTGYMGTRLIPELLMRGHQVRALVRGGSEHKLPAGCIATNGNALNCSTYAKQIRPADTFVHLIGVAHPSPAKAKEFRRIDYVAAREAFVAAKDSGVKHFIYLSVAHPAPAMHAFIQVRMECETLLRETKMNATVVRPWYVLGPGHWWPYLLIPGYFVAELIPSTRETARRLGLVTIRHMIRTLVWAVENPAEGTRVLGVQEIIYGHKQ
jgi:uncharacterized protein YbjT (DUF2867 family)